MHWSAWIVFVAMVLLGGSMAWTGAHALIAGEVAAPADPAGEPAWARLARSVGIEPRSRLMDIVIAAYGLAAIVCVIGFILDAPLAWWWQLAVSCAGLWYAPLGTIVNALVIVLLVATPLRRMADPAHPRHP